MNPENLFDWASFETELGPKANPKIIKTNDKKWPQIGIGSGEQKWGWKNQMLQGWDLESGLNVSLRNKRKAFLALKNAFLGTE